MAEDLIYQKKKELKIEKTIGYTKAYCFGMMGIGAAYTDALMIWASLDHYQTLENLFKAENLFWSIGPASFVTGLTLVFGGIAYSGWKKARKCSKELSKLEEKLN